MHLPRKTPVADMTSLLKLAFLLGLLTSTIECRRGGGSRGGSIGRGRVSGGRSHYSSPAKSYTLSGRPRTALYSKSTSTSTSTSRQSVNSNGFGFGLGVGMTLGYRPGFMARPNGYSNSAYSYQTEHSGQNYHRRNDGRIECSVGETTSYIKVCNKTLIVKFTPLFL